VQHMHLMHGGGVCHIISRNIGGLLKALCFHPQNQTQWTHNLGQGNPRFEANLFLRVDFKVKYLIRYYTYKSIIYFCTSSFTSAPCRRFGGLIRCGSKSGVDALQRGRSCQ